MPAKKLIIKAVELASGLTTPEVLAPGRQRYRAIVRAWLFKQLNEVAGVDHRVLARWSHRHRTMIFSSIRTANDLMASDNAVMLELIGNYNDALYDLAHPNEEFEQLF